jgi:beta-glucosidase
MKNIACIIYGLICVFGVNATSSAVADETPRYLDLTQPLEARVEDLLARLTLEEKVSLLHADSIFTTAAIPRLGLPRRWLSDGPHGVRDELGPDTWASANRTDDCATALPAGICLASTWNPELAASVGEVIGQEARARGKDIMLGPGVNICALLCADGILNTSAKIPCWLAPSPPAISAVRKLRTSPPA